MSEENKKVMFFIVAWLHELDITDGIPGNRPEQELTFSPQHPFGKPGVDFDESFEITSTPLYEARPIDSEVDTDD